MTLPRTRLGRIVLAVVALWIVVSIGFLVAYNTGGTTPGDGQGDPITILQQ